MAEPVASSASSSLLSSWTASVVSLWDAARAWVIEAWLEYQRAPAQTLAKGIRRSTRWFLVLLSVLAVLTWLYEWLRPLLWSMVSGKKAARPVRVDSDPGLQTRVTEAELKLQEKAKQRQDLLQQRRAEKIQRDHEQYFANAAAMAAEDEASGRHVLGGGNAAEVAAQQQQLLQAERDLVAQQDQEFAESLAADQARDAAISDAAAARAAARHAALAALPPEPEPEDPERIQVAVLVNGRRSTRCFLPSHPVSVLYHFAGSMTPDPRQASFTLVTGFPRKRLTDLAASLSDVGLTNSVLLIAEMHTAD